MARKLPDPLTRRHLLEKALPAEQSLATAELYLADGRRVEAVDFLAKAEAFERLGELRAEAVADGDLFLLRTVARACGEPASREEYAATAAAAEAAGKTSYAVDAARQGEREDG